MSLRWDAWALPMPTIKWSDSLAQYDRTSMWPRWSGWNLPITRERPENSSFIVPSIAGCV